MKQPPLVRLIYLESKTDGSKVGLDDFFAAGHTVTALLAKATSALRPGPEADYQFPYRETPHGLIWLKPTHDGAIEIPLCNFTARIIADVAEDDGVETRRYFEIEARQAARCVQTSVPAERFAGLTWATEALGARAILAPGQAVKDHPRVAIQLLSHEIDDRRVYAHLGWRKINGAWVYLHASGAIGPNGPVLGIEVTLPAALERYMLPNPPQGQELIDAIHASLRVRTVAPASITESLHAAIWRAVLGQADFSLHLAGLTGTGKSELAALIQQHYGVGLDARHLPASWSSTGNSLEGVAFAAKDAILTVDDFCPIGSPADVQRLHREADRLFRAQGNGAGRLRMRADTSLKAARAVCTRMRPQVLSRARQQAATQPLPYSRGSDQAWLALREQDQQRSHPNENRCKPPRGIILSTGENVPHGQSLRARLLVRELSPGAVDWAVLTTCQQDAAAGVYAKVLSAYVCWLAPRYEAVKEGLPEEVRTLRTQVHVSGGHKRTPSIVADLAVGLRYFLQFANEVGALTQAEVESRWHQAWQALLDAGEEQAHQQALNDPAQRFIELLTAAIASGRAHIASPEGTEPLDADMWGWRKRMVGTGEFLREEWHAQGERMGWLEADNLYLEPDAAFAVVQRLTRGQGESLPIASRTLYRRLKDGRWLVSTETARRTPWIRKTLEGRRREVLHLHRDLITTSPSSLQKSDQSDQTQSDSNWSPSLSAPRSSTNGDVTSTVPTENTEKTGASDALVTMVTKKEGEGEADEHSSSSWSLPRSHDALKSDQHRDQEVTTTPESHTNAEEEPASEVLVELEHSGTTLPPTAEDVSEEEMTWEA